MGIVNVFKGLGSERETHRFNGRLRKHLDLDWKHCKMLLGDKEITKNHAVKDDDVVYIREYPGAASAVFVGVMVTVLASVGAAAWAGVTAHRAAREAYRRMQDAIRRIGRDNRRRDVESIPHLSGARNEPAEGKQAPIILGRHLFAPYFLSEPYMRPSGRDGEDLHWYGTFLVGQTGLNLEKLRNGAIDLLSFNDTVYRNDADWTGWTSRTSDGGTVTRESGVLRATGMAWADRPGIDVSNRIVMIRARWTGSNAQKRLFTNSSLGGDNATETPLAREWAWHRVNVTRPDAPFNALFSHPRQAGDGWEVSDLYIGYENVITPSGTYAFDRPPNLDPASPPPFHDPENAIEVRQDGYFEEGIFNDRWADSLEASVEIGRKRKENAGTVGNIFVDDDGPDPVTRESAKFPMRVEVEILVDGLHGWDSNAGQPTNAAVDLRVEWSRDGVDGWQPIPITGGAGHPLGEWRPVNTDDGPGFGLTRNSARQMRFIAAVDLPASAHSDDGAPVHIRATRLTMQHTGSYRSRTLLTAIRTRQYSPRRTRSTGTPPTELVPAKNIVPSLADRFCRIGIRIKVNENTQEHMDRFNVIASMTGRTWSSGRWSNAKTATSNPAAVALEVMTGLIHEPGRHGDTELDLDSLGRLYDWCNSREVTVADSGLRPVRLESCGVLTGAARKTDVLQRVLATCDAGMYTDELGRFRFWFDDFKDTPEALLNPQRIVSINESRDLHRRAHGQAVRFIDRDGDWSERTERILRPRVKEVQGANSFDPVNHEYVTEYYHSMWLARRSMAREILQPGEIIIETGREGLHYPPGTLLKVQHEGFRIGIGSGEIVENIIENNEIVGIRTMERHDLHEDRDYWVDFHVVDGNRNHVVTRQVQSVGEYTDRLMFTSPINNAHDAPALGNIVSVIDGLREGFTRVWESKRCVVMDSVPTATGRRLTLARYDDEIYRTGVIDAIPEYRSRILPSAPRVYGAVPREPYLPSSGTVPRIGSNGNWWIGGVDTGVPAKGEDGVTPHVGANGNWWIGTVDTGVKAEGKDGLTPFVGANGNWWVGTVDTGLPAKGEDGRSLNFRGGWVTPAPAGGWHVDDVVTFAGRTFLCILANTGATPPWPLTSPVAASRWALLADKGTDGADGVTPRIGANGNWWIGSTDTGLPAKGDDGAPGVSPHVGANGNWWIGTVDTGIRAEGRDGANGLGIEAIPTDAYAYWPGDGLPDLPDNPAGTVFRQGFFTAVPAGWTLNGSPSVSFHGGVMRIESPSANHGIFSNSLRLYDAFACRVRVTRGGALIGWGGHGARVGPGDHLVTLSRPPASTSALVIYGASAGDVLEVSDIYVGNGSFLSPLPDAANGNHAVMPAGGGVIPGQGRHGPGLRFFGGFVMTPVTGGFLMQDFTVSAWINPDEVDGWNGIMGVHGLFSVQLVRVGNGTVLEFRINGPSVGGNPSVPTGGWTHLLVRRRGGEVLWDLDGGRESGRIAAAPAADIRTNFLIGAGMSPGQPANRFRGLMSGVCVWGRVLTDDERRALFLSSLSSHPRYSLDPPDERYRGATAIADLNNARIVNGDRMHPEDFCRNIKHGLKKTMRTFLLQADFFNQMNVFFVAYGSSWQDISSFHQGNF